MIETILLALDLISKAPRASEAIKKIGLDFIALKKAAAKEPKDQEDTPLERVVKGEKDKLKKLIEDYYAVDKDERFGELEKSNYRKQVATQTCRTLKAAQPIKDRIPDYDKLIELFCLTLPGIF